jgi:hypothetical protein
MLLKADDVRRTRVNDVLVVLAVLGVFAAFDVVGHKGTPYFWIKLILALTFSAGCLLLTRDREAVDTFSAVVAALFSLCAVAMTAGDRTHPNWWPFFFGFIGAAILFILLTRKRRGTLLAIAAIVAFRTLVFIVVFALHGLGAICIFGGWPTSAVSALTTY